MVAVVAFPPIFNADAVPVILVPTKAEGVPRFGVIKTGLDNVLLVKVSVPARVDKVPVKGKYTLVLPLEVNVVV